MNQAPAQMPLPTSVKIVQWLFPKLEKIAPNAAAKLGRKFFLTPLPFKISEREKAYRAKAKRLTFQLEGAEQVAYQVGEGKDIICIHGWSGRGTQFWRIADELVPKGYRLTMIDAPKHGESKGQETNIIQFAKAIEYWFGQLGTVDTVIAHSLGGSATMLARSKGCQSKKVVSISAPTEAELILEEFTSRLNAGERVKDAVRSYVVEVTGEKLEKFTSLELIKSQEPFPYFVIHDQIDEDAHIDHSEWLIEQNPWIESYFTTGLGHTRILRDKEVVDQVVDFIVRP